MLPFSVSWNITWIERAPKYLWLIHGTDPDSLPGSHDVASINSGKDHSTYSTFQRLGRQTFGPPHRIIANSEQSLPKHVVSYKNHEVIKKNHSKSWISNIHNVRTWDPCPSPTVTITLQPFQKSPQCGNVGATGPKLGTRVGPLATRGQIASDAFCLWKLQFWQEKSQLPFLINVSVHSEWTFFERQVTSVDRYWMAGHKERLYQTAF